VTEERETWGSKLQFLLATIGYAVGLGCGFTSCYFPYHTTTKSIYNVPLHPFPAIFFCTFRPNPPPYTHTFNTLSFHIYEFNLALHTAITPTASHISLLQRHGFSPSSSCSRTTFPGMSSHASVSCRTGFGRRASSTSWHQH